MTSRQVVIDELTQLQGVVGAIVSRGGQRVVSSFPGAFSDKRLSEVDRSLFKLGKLAHHAGYSAARLVLHWQHGLLFSWTIAGEGRLSLLTLVTAPRAVIELSAQVALEELRRLEESFDASESATPRAAEVQSRAEVLRIEAHLATELGPIARVLVRKATAASRKGAKGPLDLDGLRARLLEQVDDVAARRRLEASAPWRSGDGTE